MLRTGLFRFGKSDDGASGAGGNPNDALAPGNVTGAAALARVGQLYQQLQEQADRIVSVFGLKIPCDVQTRHNLAVRAYIEAAQQVFDQIKAKGGVVTQTPYTRSGKPAKPVQGGPPLTPTMFAIPGCPETAPTNVSGLGNPVVVAIARYLILSAAAAGAVAFAIHEVVVNWPNDKEQTVKAQGLWMQQRLDCIKRTQGLAPEVANAICGGVEPPKESTSWLTAIGTIVLLGAGVAGAVWVYKALRAGPAMEYAGAPSRRRRHRQIEA